MKPHTTLRNLLVHPKDKKDVKTTTDLVYEIPCKGCKKSYIGESGRLFGTRLGEHKKEVDKRSTLTREPEPSEKPPVMVNTNRQSQNM